MSAERVEFAVVRYFALFEAQPYRSKSFKLSTNHFFVEKARDVLGRISMRPIGAAAVYRRKEPNPGAGTDRAGVATEVGLSDRRD